MISIHALMKRATTHLHFDVQVGGISIHALMKRATGDYTGWVYLADLISIHALMKRATNSFIHRKVTCWHFNPRPHEEGDRMQGGIIR